jgi:exonuclease SbcD
VLTDAVPPIDPMRKLQARFPWCATLMLKPPARESDGRDYGQRVRAAASDLELVDAFLGHVRAGTGLSDAERDLIGDVLDAHASAEVLA